MKIKKRNVTLSEQFQIILAQLLKEGQTIPLIHKYKTVDFPDLVQVLLLKSEVVKLGLLARTTII